MNCMIFFIWKESKWERILDGITTDSMTISSILAISPNLTGMEIHVWFWIMKRNHMIYASESVGNREKI